MKYTLERAYPVRRHRPAPRRPWALIAIGFAIGFFVTHFWGH